MNPHRRAKWVLMVGILAFCLGIFWIWTVQASQGGTKAVRLFGTIEFRTTLKVLPRWQRVAEKAAAQMVRLAQWKGQSRPRHVIQWQRMMTAARTLSEMEKLERVNRFFNRWPYRLDREVHGVSDHWATPEVFITHSGDCEDYGIAKYFSLRQLGLTPAQLRLVVVQDRIRGIGHAVLAVYLNEDVYILDNLTDQVLPHKLYRHYLPQYSVNETQGWAHLPPKRRTAFSDRPSPDSDTIGKDP